MKTLAILAFVSILLSTAAAAGQHIHVLMVADTADSEIGKACLSTIQNVTNSLRYLIPSDRYSLAIVESSGQQYSAESVLAGIDRIHVEQDDTFVFFYDGHGARDEGHHFLQMPDGGRLWSAKLQEAVSRKPCRLCVILSGSCNVPIQRKSESAESAEQWDVRQHGIAPVVEELFLNHSGLMHMNGAWPGQFGFTDVKHGNWLFWEFFNYCTLCPTGRPTWNCIDRMMDQRLGERFQQSCNGKFVEPKTGYTQTSLKTISWSLPEAKDHPTLRFGVAVDDSFTSKGVTVTDIDSHSPASNILRNGDIIEWINGKEVSDFVAYSDLVKSSPRRISWTAPSSMTSVMFCAVWGRRT